MKAARLHEYKKGLSLDEIKTPSPGPGQVLVRVAGAGLCHSDLHIIDGELCGLKLPLPLTLGHENAGFVAAVGAGVETVKEGDKVVVFGGWGCGACAPCVTGHEQLCAAARWSGIGLDGGYAEEMLVPHERYLVKLRTLDPKSAAPLADAALTPYRAIKKALPYLEPDHPCLVIGLGGLGQYGLKLLRALSGSPIIAVDRSAAKLALAVKYGASHALNALDPALDAKILELTRGRGVCAAFDFVGTDKTLATSIAVTRAMGKVSQIGLAGGAAILKVLQNSRFEVAFEATLWGTIKELREVVALVEAGRLTLNEEEFVPLEKINEACARLREGGVTGRLVVTP